MIIMGSLLLFAWTFSAFYLGSKWGYTRMSAYLLSEFSLNKFLVAVRLFFILSIFMSIAFFALLISTTI